MTSIRALQLETITTLSLLTLSFPLFNANFASRCLVIVPGSSVQHGFALTRASLCVVQRPGNEAKL